MICVATVAGGKPLLHFSGGCNGFDFTSDLDAIFIPTVR
jgi:hypothetical protein